MNRERLYYIISQVIENYKHDSSSGEIANLILDLLEKEEMK